MLRVRSSVHSRPSKNSSPLSRPEASCRSCSVVTTPFALPDVRVSPPRGLGSGVGNPFDAHADTGDSQFGSLYGHGSPCVVSSSRAPVAATVSCRWAFAVLARPETLHWMSEQGMRSFEMSEIVRRGLDAGARRSDHDRPGRL